MAKEEKKSVLEQYRESQENAFLREVSEDVQREKILKLWYRFKYLIIGAATAALAVGIIVAWSGARMERIAGEEAAAFDEIVANSRPAERVKDLIAFAEGARYGYRDVAYQAAYSLQLEAKDFDGAIGTLKTAIDRATDRSFRNAVTMKLALMPEYKDADDKIARLRAMGSRDWPYFWRKAPFADAGRLVLALVYIQEGRDKEAEGLVSQILDDKGAPPEVREQAETLAIYIKTRSML